MTATVSIAVYGGSFDPPHIGHALCCAYVLAAHAIDRLLVVPVAFHPFSKPLSRFEDRLQMCELGLRDSARVEVSSIEAELPAPSLTVHTLERLQQQYPDARLHLVVGSDLLPETSSWFDFDRVRTLAPLIVVPRAGHLHEPTAAPALPDINSTDLRERLRSGRSTQGLLNPKVAAYAISRGLYR